MIRKPILIGSMLALGVALLSCSLPVTLVTVQSFEAQSPQAMDIETVFNPLMTTLIDRGFDIKMSNKESGIITTEYKQFAATGNNPSFDYYLQIRMVVKELENGQIVVKMNPIVKAQNRMNAAAYTEHELNYYTGKPDNLKVIDSMGPGGWQTKGQILFMNVVNDVSSTLKISIEEVKQNITETPKKVSLF